MKIFSYTATDQDGKLIRGELESVDRNTVATNIISQGLTPVKIKTKNSISLNSEISLL